ncbi:MAG: biotin/lipoyl-binding protein [Acidobacteria bacterium]|nr:biotin/lipoyl-binding protein [Acidobacteriota bacterium]
MKIEARHSNRTFHIDLEEQESSDSGSLFKIRIQRPDGEQVLRVRVLSRSQERWTLEVNGQIEDVLVSEKKDELLIDWNHQTFAIQISPLREKLPRTLLPPETPRIASLTAQMTGRVIAVLAVKGDVVEVGQGLVVIEAMKMQNELKSPKSGTVMTCNVQEGEIVKAGDLLFEID